MSVLGWDGNANFRRPGSLVGSEVLVKVARRKKALTNSFERFDKTAVPSH